MKKRYQVFVSSTYTDLIEERKEVSQAILKCNCFPAGMELFPASTKEKWAVIKNVIDDSDFFILIIAGRYGSLGIDDQGKKMGYTEMEYDYAIATGKPVLAFIHSNPKKIAAEFVETDKDMIIRLEKFRSKVSEDRIIAKWDNKDHLHSVVISSLNDAIKNNPTADGWMRANETKTDHSEKLSINIDKIISEFEKISSSYEKLNFLSKYDNEKRKNIFNNEFFIRHYIQFLDNCITDEALLWEAITTIPSHYLDKRIKDIVVSEAKIVAMFNQLCLQAKSQDENKLLIHTIRLLRNLDEYKTDYSMPVFNLLKSDTNDNELKDACFNYCEFLCLRLDKNETHKNIVSYILDTLKNKEPLFPKKKWIELLLSSCAYESDMPLIHNVFFDNDKETKQYVLDGMFRFCGSYMFIHDIKMQNLFFEICEEAYSWDDDYYTASLLQYCLFTRTIDIFTVDEIYEKLDSVNNDVFYLFFSGFISDVYECYELNDKEKERIRNIIKMRKHPRGNKLLELFDKFGGER